MEQKGQIDAVDIQEIELGDVKQISKSPHIEMMDRSPSMGHI
jgi:hypothetical protein